MLFFIKDVYLRQKFTCKKKQGATKKIIRDRSSFLPYRVLGTTCLIHDRLVHIFPTSKIEKCFVNVSYVSHMYQSRLVQGHKINYGKNLIDNIKTYRCSYSSELSNLATLAQQGQSPAFPFLNLYVHTPSLFTSVTLLASPAILPGLNPPPILNTTKAITENCSGCGDPDVS